MEPDRSADQTPDETGAPEAPVTQPCAGSESAKPNEVRPHASVELLFDTDSGILKGRLTVVEGAAPVTLDDLRQQVEDGGHGDLCFEPDALAGLLRKAQACEEGDYTIATRRDAQVSVAASADRLQVLLSTTRAYGGAPVTAERIREATRAAGISAELLSARAIDQAVSGEPVKNAVIGEGIAPQSGMDSRVEVLVDLGSETSRPRQHEDGRVDHYSVREFLIVDPDTHLLRRHGPTKGTPGRDVMGKSIAARDGKDRPLPKEMPGVKAHEEDPNLLVAEFKGHPVLIPGGIRVDKTLVMEYVDLRTGNVDFDGSVLVTGDIAAGVTVKATGDVTVKGTAENAFIDAGANLIVARGISGSDSAMQGGKREAWAKAAGDLRAGFAGGVHLRAGGNVVVKEYLNHCDTMALGQVLVGQKGGRGLIVGGLCHGCQGVAARVAGTPATVPTGISAGLHQTLEQTHRTALDERKGLVDRLDQLKAMLASMEGREAGSDERQNLVDKVRRTIDEFERRTAEVDDHIARMAEDLAAAEQAAVVCNQRIHPGVTIEIGAGSLTIRTEASGGRFTCQDHEIHWE